MKKKRSFLWGSVVTLALASAAVLSAGFILALSEPGEAASTLQSHPASTAQQEAQPAVAVDKKADDPLLIVAIGDSLTKGIGDTSGKGYVGNLKSRLEAAGQKVNVQNLGISGLESTELVKSVQNPGVQQYFQDAELIMVSIGGNDITHSIGGVDKLIGAKGVDENTILETQAAYTKNVQEVLASIRKSNAKTPVIVLGLYNPFEGLFEDQGKSDQLLLDWNENLRKVAQAYPHVKVVPMFDLFQWNNSTLLSYDHFHPNNEGYAKMAERIYSGLPKEFLK
ncbi:lysophospholipase L1-like esterase [Tumebacillus sp. BK434]|uniref:GDSL-type esterase/lipase family protein n=1 Tax=Tumebacillus sp. BK434 TaxID=2512169 RepID=UPI00104D8DFC|nr:GDSL-type esterase/lipase family protein [Tumebacillus sp. BK434]TCP53371.1 lysophospholipase L1-like esterase [Tumebacillus sp. BK434]